MGANPETAVLVHTARDMGVYTVVTDYDHSAYAKKFADKACDVDGMDVPGLVALARAEVVDGVLVGVADRLIVPYQQVCEALGLPCYGTLEQCAIFTDKQKFNQRCLEYGITPIPSFDLGREFCENDLERLRFPLFIKPVDGNSGKGMSICHEKSEVRTAIEKALAFSRSGRFLVERYMDCDDLFINFTFKDGEFWPSAVADRYTSREQGNLSRVCLGATYPSKHVDLYFDTLHEKFCRMFKDMGVQHGVFMVSAFVEDGVIHVYDPGFRLQGEAPNLHIEAVNGFDQKAMLVRYALTGSMGEQDLGAMNDCRFRGKHAATIWYLAKEGTIARIEGLEEVAADPAVFKVVQRLYEGDLVTRQMVGTEAQVLARLYMACNTKEELVGKLKQLQDEVMAYTEKGIPMLLDGFDVRGI
ncbi:MAG: carbamoyl-phosphate-synthetase [Verrucomicrobiota bacterium]